MNINNFITNYDINLLSNEMVSGNTLFYFQRDGLLTRINVLTIDMTIILNHTPNFVNPGPYVLAQNLNPNKIRRMI